MLQTIEKLEELFNDGPQSWQFFQARTDDNKLSLHSFVSLEHGLRTRVDKEFKLSLVSSLKDRGWRANGNVFLLKKGGVVINLNNGPRVKITMTDRIVVTNLLYALDEFVNVIYDLTGEKIKLTRRLEDVRNYMKEELVKYISWVHDPKKQKNKKNISNLKKISDELSTSGILTRTLMMRFNEISLAKTALDREIAADRFEEIVYK